MFCVPKIHETLPLKVDYNKTYNSQDEETFRRNIFSDNLKTIRNHNLKFRRGRTTFEMGINQFADKKFEEFLTIFVGSEPLSFDSKEFDIDVKKFKPLKVYGEQEDQEMKVPTSFDWRDRGAVTRVKNQLSCGSCYAMAGIAAIESHHFIVHDELISLSEQEVVDCARKFIALGCRGGVDFKVFDYVKANGGISADHDYPYEGKAGECRISSKKVTIAVEGYGIVSSRKSPETLKKALISIGPTMISLDFNHETFMRYAGGIYYDDDCSEVDMKHSALLIGFGRQNGEDFWIVKNSFGESWGEAGYIRMAMNRGGNCGVTAYPLFPVMKNKESDHDDYVDFEPSYELED